MPVAPGPPVVVGLTTLPSRIAELGPTLESLMAQTRVPDRIVLSIPPTSRRESCGYELPERLLAEDAWGGRLAIARTPVDYGPGTKLLGCVSTLAEPSIVILVDDDVRYAPYLVESLVAAQSGDHGRSFSFYAYREGGITVGQGCDGFSFWSPNLDGIAEWGARVVEVPALFVHDDLWISFYLQRRGVRIRRLRPHREAAPLVYEQLDRENSLRDLEGDLQRDVVHAEGLRHLMEHESPTWGMRTRWTLWRASRRLGLHRVRRRLRRLVGAGA